VVESRYLLLTKTSQIRGGETLASLSWTPSPEPLIALPSVTFFLTSWTLPTQQTPFVPKKIYRKYPPLHRCLDLR